ncbi:hypothetical protein CARUB_v10007789mg [Capsella rubella]|uniref:Uncharacterized protein n=2 Tax=Capsella rubella TaxID=81985 RepID=R0H374_9BRAS|nr:hypothetical protein CARUB_v10007789mg [Capsella rubella]
MSKEEARIAREMLMLSKYQAPRIEESLSRSESTIQPKLPDLNMMYDPEREEEGRELVKALENLTNPESQDAAHYGISKLYSELEVEIFARVSCTQYWKLNFLNKEFSQLLQSREIFKVRRELGLVQPYVFMFSGGDTCWTVFGQDFKNFRQLPEIPSDTCFLYGDKETICAGTHLIVIGKEEKSLVVWRYEMEMDKWIKDEMITPRVMYASASHGTNAFFAGGINISENGIPEVVNVAERYDSETKTWKAMKAMHKRRKSSSGFFLRGKFYALGGRNENEVYLTCGERYDEMTDSWTLIPDMLKGMMFEACQSPPLIAVVNDELYLLESWCNEVWVYDMNANAWKNLGVVPVRANAAYGWGVAFKSVGDRLLVIGASSAQPSNKTMSVYTCRPSEQMVWEENKHCCDGVQLDHFIRNCCVMFT